MDIKSLRLMRIKTPQYNAQQRRQIKRAWKLVPKHLSMEFWYNVDERRLDILQVARSIVREETQCPKTT